MERISPSELRQAQLFQRHPVEPVALLSPFEIAVLEQAGAHGRTVAELERELLRDEHFRHERVPSVVAFLRRRRLIEPLHEYETAPRSGVVYVRTQLGASVLAVQRRKEAQAKPLRVV